MIRGIGKGDSFDFTVFRPEEVDRRFNNIIERCKDEFSVERILQIIHEEWHNQMFPMMPLDNTLPSLSVFRVTLAYPEMNLSDPLAFAHNPKASNMGRAHIPGYPVFYGASQPSTAMKEMKEHFKKGASFYLSKWELDTSEALLAHFILANSATTSKQNFIREIVDNQIRQMTEPFKNAPDFVANGFKQYLVRMGDLFAIPNTEQYNITSAYAHHILYKMREIGANVDLIFYPSVVHDFEDVNFAIHPSVVSTGRLKLQSVFKLKVVDIGEENVQISTNLKGVNKDDTVEWYTPALKIDHIDYDKIEVITHDKTVYKGSQALQQRINNSDFTVESCAKQEINKYLLWGLKQLPFEGDILSFESAERQHYCIFQCNHGWKLETGKGHGCIDMIKVPVKWTEYYEKKLTSTEL